MLLYISFAWTTQAFLANAKSRTRRYWNDDYAQRFIKAFQSQEIIGALDKLFRTGGKPIGELLLTAEPHKEPTGLMNKFDYEAEGLLWMERQKLSIKGQAPYRFFEDWKQRNDLPWVIDFKRIK